jgi:hypothetical protein
VSVSETTPAPATRTLRFTPNNDDYSPTAGALEINADGKATVYIVEEFPCDLIRRGFVLTKLVGDGSGPTVFADCRGARWDSCSCEGFRFKHRCRHCGAVRKLVDTGRL